MIAILLLIKNIIAFDISYKVEVVKIGQAKVRAGTRLFDLVSGAIIKVSQAVATPIQAAKLAKANMKYGPVIEDEAETLKNLAKLNQVLDEFEVAQQSGQQALALVAALNNGRGLNEI